MDKELWEKFKLRVARRGLEVSQAIEGLIREELLRRCLMRLSKEWEKLKVMRWFLNL